MLRFSSYLVVAVTFSLFAADGLFAQGALKRQNVAVVNFSPSELNAANHPTTLAIGPLIASRSDQRWLSKAIADLLIKSLSEVEGLAILERERMQAFSDEVALADSALFSQERALRVGRVAKVQKVVFGSYSLSGKEIKIRISLLDLDSQRVLVEEEISGPFEQLRSLAKELTLEFLKAQKIQLSEREKRDIQFELTESISATEYFYRAIDFYDQGRYPEAFGDFLAATKQDPNYFEAELWLGKMFESMGYHRHAVVSYEKLYATHPQTVEGLDALLFAAQTLELKLKRQGEAIDAFRRLSGTKPTTPHSLEASFHLGKLLQQRGRRLEAYLEFQKVDTFRQQVTDLPSRLSRFTQRKSRFVTWDRVLTLYRDSIVNMVSLYSDLIRGQEDLDQLPNPPRGAILLNPVRPSFQETRFGHTESLFPKEVEYSHWQEKSYVVIVPKNYVATGVDFSVTGRLKKRRPYHSYAMRILPFPLLRDFDRKWLGAIFGQTAKKSTLRKTVSFHGDTQEVFTVQLIENQSTIYGWEIDVRLVPRQQLRQEVVTRVVESDPRETWEGKPVAEIELPEVDGSTRTLAQAYYEPKKEIDLLQVPGKGHFLVVALGALDGQQTDLWFSRSDDGREWRDLERLPLNSSSEDFNPRLVPSEDWHLWLAWISTRRGKGWELWLSSLRPKPGWVLKQPLREDRWSHPHRVPLERFADPGMEKRIKRTSELLEYDLYQDREGQWILCYYSYDKKAIIFLHSADALTWEELTQIPTQVTSYGLSFIEDSSGVYRLGYFGKKGKLHLWSSTDGKSWHQRWFDIKFWNQSCFPTPSIHRMRLFALNEGNLLMIVSDNEYGLQFARFHADLGEPLLDLVGRSGLQAYGITRHSKSSYLVALKESDRVVLRQYQKFTIHGQGIEKDTRNWPIYMESEEDREGNHWQRIFAQSRRRVSDVTSLGIEPSGRLWWGIESGIMYKEGEQFLATDVSLGFFHHFITDITCCSDGRVWFSSQYLDRPELGTIRNPKPISKTLSTGIAPRFTTVWVPKIEGSITATACGRTDSELFVGSSDGKVVGFDGEKILFERSLEAGAAITGLEFDEHTGDLWVATVGDGLYRLFGKQREHFTDSNGLAGDNVVDLVVDRTGALWIAIYGQGLMRYRNRAWSHFTPENSGLLYWSLGELVRDHDQGILYLPHSDVRSRGLGYFDGERAASYNPPHDTLRNPSSLVCDENGIVWIGTWFDGLYKLERKRLRR